MNRKETMLRAGTLPAIMLSTVLIDVGWINWMFYIFSVLMLLIIFSMAFTNTDPVKAERYKFYCLQAAYLLSIMVLAIGGYYWMTAVWSAIGLMTLYGLEWRFTDGKAKENIQS